MYPNLNAELARNNITIIMLADRTHIPYATLAPKIRGEKPIKLDEAKLIRDAIDKSLSLEYLFEIKEVVES